MTPFDWTAVEPGDEIGVVQLGKYGDLISLMPVFRIIFERTGKVPWVMTHSSYADVFDGVSYAKAFVTGETDYQKSVAQARSIWRHVMVPQGFMAGGKAECKSYQEDQWRYAGLQSKFGWYRPEFDCRDLVREQELKNRFDWSKRVVLLSLNGAATSPFLWGPEFEHILKHAFPSVTFIDIGTVRSERIYDLLGLMDKAHFLITCDTSTLHLASASHVPVIANQPDWPLPWLASALNCNCVASFNYRECVSNIDQIIAALRIGIDPVSQPSRPKMFHAVSTRDAEGDTERRLQVARLSWDHLYSQGVIRTHFHERYCLRTSATVGDPVPKPFLKDILRSAMVRSGDEDIIVLTNDDTVLHPSTADAIFTKMRLTPVCCSWRSDYEPGQKPFVSDTWSPGRDLFAFTKKWLVYNFDDIPDYVFGVGDWDFYFSMKFRLSQGIRFHKDWCCEHNSKIDLPRGYVFHEKHQAPWRNNNSPALRYNRWLTAKWITKHNLGRFCNVPNDI